MALIEKKVRDLYVECSLQVRNFQHVGLAASDCCRAPANFAVTMENRDRMWRCTEHMNVRSLVPLEVGRYSQTIMYPED